MFCILLLCRSLDLGQKYYSCRRAQKFEHFYPCIMKLKSNHFWKCYGQKRRKEKQISCIVVGRVYQKQTTFFSPIAQYHSFSDKHIKFLCSSHKLTILNLLFAKMINLTYTVLATQMKIIFSTTGSTPLGTYRKLIEFHKAGTLSFKYVKTFNMDEYVSKYVKTNMHTLSSVL